MVQNRTPMSTLVQYKNGSLVITTATLKRPLPDAPYTIHQLPITWGFSTGNLIDVGSPSKLTRSQRRAARKERAIQYVTNSIVKFVP